MANSADPDQLASLEANWSGTTLFAKTEHVVFSKRRVQDFFSFYHEIVCCMYYLASTHAEKIKNTYMYRRSKILS